MKSGKQISIGRILWNVLKKPIIKELTMEDASDLAISCIRLLGASAVYNKSTEKVQLSGYKAKLPDNSYRINGVRYRDCENCDFENALSLREATDLYHVSKECNGCNDGETPGELTYIIQQNVIVTTIEEGWLEIAFDGIEVDSAGFPMIPDDEVLIKAIEYFIIWSYLENIIHTGKVTDRTFSYYEQKKLFYMTSAENSFKMPSIDMMESMSNAMNRILIRTNWHDNFFKYFGEKERFKRHY